MADKPFEDHENRRASLSFEQLTERENLTFEELKAKKYRGEPLTAKQLKQLEDHEQEAPLEYQDRPRRKYEAPPRKDHGKFEEGDVIEYMYKNWFLGGANWLFDKIEDGVESFIGRTIDRFSDTDTGTKTPTETVVTKDAEEFEKKAKSFQKSCQFAMGVYERACDEQKRKYKEVLGELNVDFSKLSRDQEAELRKHYSEDFISALKKDSERGLEKGREKDSEKVTKFVRFCEPELIGTVNLFGVTKSLAMRQTYSEMKDEAMRSSDVWKDEKTKEYKSDNELKKEFNKKATDRHLKILDAVASISESARLRAKAEYSLLEKPEDQARFIKENVLDVYDKMIAESKSEKEKKAQEAAKAEFLKDINERKALGEGAREARIFQAISSLKVNEYLTEQAKITDEVQKLQAEEMAAQHYDANGSKPKKDIKDKIDEFKNKTDKAIKDGKSDDKLFKDGRLKERISKKMSLYEAGVNEETGGELKVLNAMMSMHVQEEKDQSDRKRNSEEYRREWKEAGQKILLKKSPGKALLGAVKNFIADDKSR